MYTRKDFTIQIITVLITIILITSTVIVFQPPIIESKVIIIPDTVYIQENGKTDTIFIYKSEY